MASRDQVRPPNLRRKLRSWHIYFIGVGGIIGVGFFNNSSLILGISGPAGALVAFALVGLVSIAVMEGICEMIVLWPIPNAMVEFIRAFVDEDLAIVVGVAYWYTYCVIFTALVVGAANLANYWAISSVWKSTIFFLVPIMLWIINALRVEVYGSIEFVGGIAKLILVAAVFLLMICINLGAGSGDPIHSTYFNAGLQNNPNVADSHFTAVCVSIPLATFAYIGVELITMTAFEAKNPTDLKFPAKNLAWTMTVIYILTTLVFVLNVKWNDARLPSFYNQGLANSTGGLTSRAVVTGSMQDNGGNTTVTMQALRTHSAPVIAVINAQINFLPGILNACFIYSDLSAANTALYVASRALFGLTRDIRIEDNSGRIIRAIAKMATVESRTESPWWALLSSGSILFWLPFINLSGGFTKDELQEILISIGSVSCVLVWSSQCLVFIRYYRWLKRHESLLTGEFKRLKRSSSASHLAHFQPLIAWLGLAATLLIVFFFNVVSLWTGNSKTIKSICTFLSPLILIVFWVGLKYRRWRNNGNMYVRLEDPRDFIDTIRHLDSLIYLVNDSAPVDEDRNNSADFESAGETRANGAAHGMAGVSGDSGNSHELQPVDTNR